MSGRGKQRRTLFWISRFLVAAACALLVYSFVVIDGSDGFGSEENSKEGIQKSKDEKILKRKDPRLVFMVIDAFRLSFLTSPDSPMSFTKSSIANSKALLFDTYARMPTVTLPRITAYITGTLPSFGTILTNLATDEIKIDNWISRLEGLGKRIHFFGDDTWIRLLPGKFEKFDGVTSFFVNDYTEVDQNVTRNLEAEFKDSESRFDILILHYLGLDHIGHSLGGTSPKIGEKLKEMDEIIARIYKFLNSEDATSSESSESYFIICGDHGMTPAGSHGGASPDETRVPVIIFKIGGNSNFPQNEILKIEQIDVSATIFDMFDLNFPPNSYGISLIEHFRNETLQKQHAHFKNLVKIKNLPISDICEKCDYSQKFLQKSLRKWFRKVQEELIGTASEIPNAAIWCCVFMLIGATITSVTSWISGTSNCTLLIFLLNLTNFASSLIEEEHEIWFYLGSTVVAIKVLKWIIRRKTRKWKELRLLFTIALLHRISYGYLQSTRRRWSMDPSLLPESAFSKSLDFEVQDLNEILKSQPILVIEGSFFLWMMMFGGKNRGLIVIPMISQILRYSEVEGLFPMFHQLVQLAVFPIAYFQGSLLIGLFPLLLSLIPLSRILLSFMVFRIGRISKRMEFGVVENLILFMSSFFSFGNSNSLSTLSLTSAYVGLLDYYPFLVGVQLLLYTYAGPILFVCGRISTSSESPESPEFNFPWPHLLFSYRISSLAISLVCLYHFQNHLFVWSVYSPKVVYDMAHVIISGALSSFL